MEMESPTSEQLKVVEKFVAELNENCKPVARQITDVLNGEPTDEELKGVADIAGNFFIAVNYICNVESEKAKSEGKADDIIELVGKILESSLKTAYEHIERVLKCILSSEDKTNIGNILLNFFNSQFEPFDENLKEFYDKRSE